MLFCLSIPSELCVFCSQRIGREQPRSRCFCYRRRTTGQGKARKTLGLTANQASGHDQTFPAGSFVIKPTDKTDLRKKNHFQLCDASSPDNEENSQIYSAPVAELGSTTNLNQMPPPTKPTTTMASSASSATSNEKNGNNAQLPIATAENVAKKKKTENIESNVRLHFSHLQRVLSPFLLWCFQTGAGGYATDEELELCQTLDPINDSKKTFKQPLADEKALISSAAEAATSPSKEVLIGGDNNPSRR